MFSRVIGSQTTVAADLETNFSALHPLQLNARDEPHTLEQQSIVFTFSVGEWLLRADLGQEGALFSQVMGCQTTVAADPETNFSALCPPPTKCSG